MNLLVRSLALTTLHALAPVLLLAQTLEDQWWVPNGPVNAIVRDSVSGTVYLGGDFTAVGAPARFGAWLDPVTGTPDLSWAQPNGTVINGIPDGTGGWFICGSFTQVGGLPRTRVARLASTGSVTAFNVDIPTGTVRRLLLSGDTLYMGGDFTAANNQRNLLAVNAGTGAFLDLFPGGINGIVRALEKSGSTVWAGGNFTRTNGDGPKLSQLDKNSSITDWHFVKPAGGDVLCSAPDGAGGWYIGGTFTTVGGVARLRAARINADGTLHAWDPNVNADVNSIEVDGGIVYLGGTFTTVGGQARGRLAAVDAATGAVLPFFAGQGISPGFNVNDLVVNGSDLIVGGRFSFTGTTEPFGVKLDITTGAADANYVNPGSLVYTSTPDGSGGWFIGGTFTQVNGVARVGVARINADGTLNPWTTTCNGIVFALHFDGSTLYMGGSFTTVGGQPRRLVAAVDGTTGAVLPFNANNVSGTSILALHKEGSTLYVGGGFLDMGGTTRQNLAALDATTGAILPGWKHVTNAGVRALTGNGTDVFAGGEFTLTGLDRPSGTAVDPVTGEPDFSYLEPNSTIYAAVPDGSGGWYVGGSFDQIGFTARSRIARINADGSVHPWNPGSNNTVRCLLLHGGVLYAGGDFTQLGGQTRNFIGALDITTGTATAWNPNLNAAVLTLGTDGTNIVAGGSFTTLAGNHQPNYVSLNPATGLRAYDVAANGNVNAVKGDGTALYAGGAFTAVGRAIRHGAVMTTGNSTAFPDVVMPNNEVHCSMPDGAGGWYIGGSFTAVGGVTRNRAARINADGTLHPWNPNSNGVVYSMAMGAGVVYLGGSFTSVAGNTRNRIAAVDATTGVATAWNPNANEQVFALVVDGSNVYAGGLFNTIGGQTRQKLAQLDATTGLASSWNANMSSSTSAFVMGLELSGAGTLYVAGEFGSLGGAARIRAGEVSLTTALATSWAPSGIGGTTLCIRVNDANSVFIGQTGGPGITKWNRTTGAQIGGWNALVAGSAIDIRVDAGVVYFGGQFTSAGGQVRHHAAALDATTATPLPWNPMLNTFFLRTISIAGGNMFIGGGFTLVNVAFRDRLVELAPVTGAITAWNPNMNASVLALDFDATTVYAGGAFTTVNGSTGRNRIAALDRATGTATSWSPNADSDVVALWKKDASTIYVGGYFDNIGGAVRSRLAEIDLGTGLATSWDPSPQTGGTNHVKTVAYDGTRTYVGGQFQYMKAVTRNYTAAFDMATHDRTAWNPNGNNIVHALAMNGTHVVAGGEFLSFGGAVRNRVAEVNATTGTATAWDANANGIVHAVRASAGNVFLGGAFTNVGGTERTRLAAVDGTTGALQAWDPGADATVRTLSINGSDVYVGGDFQLISGKPRSGLMAVDKSTSAITAWDPRVSSLNSIHQMFIDGGHLYVGGFFGSIKGVSRSSLAAVDLVTGVPNSWNPGANSEVYTLAKHGSTVYCGGVFTTLAGQPRNNLGAVDATTGAIVAWNPAPNGVVRALATDGTRLYIGGVFTTLMSTTRNRAASVDLPGLTLSAWNPNADGEVSDIALLGNKAFLTGAFTNIGGDTRNSLASWNVATGTINSFNPGANNDVHDLVINGSTLYVAGEFNNLSATTRNRIGAVNATTGTITTWNPDASTTVTDIALAGSTMYACGPFTTIGGASRLRLAELNLASNTATTWNPGISGGAATPNRLTLTPTSVIVAGGFTTAGGQPRVNIAEVDRTTGLATGWNPDPNATLQTVVYDGTDVFAGGSFTIIGNQPRTRLAALAANGALTAWNPGAGATVRALALDANNVYVGGDFTTAGGQPRNRIAAIDRTTGTATAWNPNSNGAVHALHLNNGALYAGGTFSTIGVLPRLRIARIDLSTGLATAWAPTVTGTQVSAIQRSGNTVWLSGSFSDVNVTPRSNLASVDATTGTLTPFNPNAIGAVNTLLLDGNDLYAGGTFTQIGGQARNRFAKLNATTGVVDASDALANNPVLGMAHSGTKLITGGSFTSIGGAARERTAVLDKSTLGATGWDIGATNNNVNVVATDGVRAYFGGLFTTFGGTTRAHFGVATLCASPVTYYRDSDGDGFGDPLASVQLCEQVPGVVTDNTDCNDTDAAQYPNAPCDDLNACTSPDAYDATCTCVGTPLPDGDGDGTCDAQDGCPADPLKTAPGQCGCGTPDTDTDGDLTADCNDGCPADPLKTAPGQCGCGVADTDTDGDLTADCNDGCPTDPLKTAPGPCGCGVADTDTDGDLTADCNDGCPTDPLKIAPGTCGCGTPDTDTDGDGLADCVDNCPMLFGQIGSACDDGIALTTNDVVNASCACAGSVDLPVGYPHRPGSGRTVNLVGDQGRLATITPTEAINPGTGPWTMEFWVRDNQPAPYINNYILIGKNGMGGIGGGPGGAESDAFAVTRGGATLPNYSFSFTDANGNTQIIQTGPANPEWHHVAVVRDTASGTIRAYRNGQLMATQAMTTGEVAPSNALVLGAGESSGGSGYSSQWNGYLDELRIWRSAVSETDLRDHMCKKDLSAHPNIASLEAYYRFDEGFGSNLIDLAGQDNNGTFLVQPGWPNSKAAIGDISAHTYAGGSVTLTDGSSCTASNLQHTTIAHVYRVNEPPNTTVFTGHTDTDTSEYYGVFLPWMNPTMPTSDVAWDYGANTLLNGVPGEPQLRLAGRDLYASVFSTAGVNNFSLDTALNLMSTTSQLRGEYIAGFNCAGACSDGDPCTIGDTLDVNCACVSTPVPDTDGDGACDAIDGCPTDPLKTAPGICGCGVPDTDTDGDLTADCNDGCPTDPLKTAPGQCGCGVADTDTDGDGIADCIDTCPTLAGQVGDACDDGDHCTEDDVITAACQCAGTTVLDVTLTSSGGYTGVICGQEVSLSASATTFFNWMEAIPQSPLSYPIADGSLTGPGPGNGYAMVLDTNNRTVDASTVILVQASLTYGRAEDVDAYLIGPNNCGAVELVTDDAGLWAGGIAVSNEPSSGLFAMEGSITSPPDVHSGPNGQAYSVPQQPLVGCPFTGDWRLFIADDSTGAPTTQNSWALSLGDMRGSPYTYTFQGAGTITAQGQDSIGGLLGGAWFADVPFGEQTYMVTITASNGCEASDTVSVLVAPQPDAYWTGGGVTVCEEVAPDLILHLQGTAPFTIDLYAPVPGTIVTSDTTLIITDPAPGYYAVSGFLDGNGCPLLAPPSTFVSFDTVAYAYFYQDTAYACDGEAVLQIYSNLPGGWSGGLGTFSDIHDPAATYTMHPSELTTGTTLIWTGLVPDPGPCDPVMDSVRVIFKPSLSAVAGASGSYCSNEPVAWELNGPGPVLVSFSTPYSTDLQLVYDSIFTQSPSPGEFYLTELTYPNGECPATSLGDTIVVDTVYYAPLVTCGTTITLCGNVAPLELPHCDPANGTYSGPGISGGLFDPGSLPSGTHELTYTYVDVNGCTDTEIQLVDVLTVEAVSCPSDTLLCADGPPLVLTGAAPAGGSFFGPGVSAGVFDPAIAGIGAHAIGYARTGLNGCADTCWSVITVASTQNWYVDADGDGSGDASGTPTASCVSIPGQVPNNTDLCDSDPLKTAPGQCGCGEVDTDTDNDLTADCNDGCPTDPTKTWEGICGCGVPDVDGDGDTVMDCLDGCPTDPDKVAPGVCGCGTPDTDTDGDATPDCNDLCPMDPNKTAPGSCGCGQAEPGSACDDGDPLTGNDLVNASCQCVGQPLDCAGVPGGSALPGTPCDDGDANTINDVYGATCLCAGTPANAGVQLTLSTDAAAAQTSWEIIPQGGGTAVCSGSGYANNSTQVLGCPIVAGCYELRVLDSFGDGMGTGGYVLRDANGQRIIDNAGDGVFTFESRIANHGGFCLPLGTDRLRASRCDLEGLLPTDWVAAEENPAVSAQYGVGNQADDGYQFWFFNPDGGYSRRILVTHASASYLFPAGATRACHLGFAGIITNPLPQQQLLNVRVRSLVNGAYAAFGPACRLRIGAACTTTQLTNNPLSSEHSCGVTRSFGGSDKLFADAVPGANRYRFRFERIGGGFTRMIASGSRVLTLKWNTLPLVAGDSYTVTVAASYDAGATWCPTGAACTVAITAPATAQQRSEVSSATDLLVFPNPNRGDVVNVLADGLPIEATTAELAITDLFGKQVYTGQVPVADGAVRQVIDLSGRTASGVYLVVLRVEGTEQVRRLVIE